MPIVITGCYDRFHEGHKAFLLFASAFSADMNQPLIVLINSDSSIKRLKGENRPIDTLSKREENISKLLSSLNWKPGFAIFSFDSEEELLKRYETIKPTMIIHGADITDTSKAVGFGRWPYLFIPKIKDTEGNIISTTRIIENDK